MKTPIYTGIFQSDLEAAGYKITGLPTPLASSEAATKGYVDLHSGGGGGSNPMITVNVKDSPYNAAGDGTTDDSAAIQSAITDVAAFGGGTIFFPRGTYLCNGAFDSTANSILTIPFRPVNLGGFDTITIAFLGEAPVEGGACPIIKSTKTGSGTAPAILSTGPPRGGVILDNSLVNFTMVYVNNLEFRTNANPTIGGLRLESACWAVLEDISVSTDNDGTEPTHGTTAIWMPNSGNGGRNYANRIRVYGFDTAFKTGEHFRAPDIFAFHCKTGIDFMPANESSWVNLMTYQLNTDVKFSGHHSVQMLLDTEHGLAGVGWFAPGTAIVDPSNYGRGEIKYQLVESNTGPISGPITMSGGNYLTLTDYQTAITTHAVSGYYGASTFYIGTDARLVSISGGVKLEVRNTGTGTWVEATRYTNP